MTTEMLEAPAKAEKESLRSDTWIDHLLESPAFGEKQESFEDHLEPIAPSLYSCALRLVRNTHRAEDLVQETLIRAWQKFDRFKLGTNFKAWVFRIMRFVHLNEKRRRTGRHVAFEHGAEPSTSYARQAGNRPPAHAIVDWGEFYGEDVEDELTSALDRLGAKEQQILMLTALCGLTYKESSEALNIPIGTVMSKLHRTRMHLQGSLKSSNLRGVPNE